ncbi:TPA: SEL1-like repeat protein, partial [Aeromonas hydrophila]|nr:SEL1-like repeat protein [Aeromonas hydrophila]
MKKRRLKKNANNATNQKKLVASKKKAVASTFSEGVLSLDRLEKSIQGGDADAMLNLGNRYRHGQGVPQDLTRARELFEQAVQADHPGAM